MPVGSSDTLRAVIDAGRDSKRLDELSSARVIGKIAMLAHAAQQKAGAGKAIGPITPSRIGLASTGAATLEEADAGSLGYSAPEQIASGSGDRRSDVFSLGAVMWETLTHQRLFDAMNDAAVRAAVTDREITPPEEINANIPAELSAICMRALSRNPSNRYQSLKVMAVEIEEFLDEAGYTDDDTKIAQYLAGMPRKPAPSILTAEPPRPKSPSGAALAAALANANTAPAAGNGLPAATPTSTMIGVPVASDWVDKTPPAHAAPPVAVAPMPSMSASGLGTAATAPATAMPVPLTPMPPILPSASQSAVRTDKSTMLGAVVAPLRVAATIEAKHTEAKPSAVIVDEPVPEPSLLAKVESAESTRSTLIDTTPPAILNAVADAKAADAARLEEVAKAAKADEATADATKADEAAKADAAKADAAKADAAKADAAKADAAKTEAKPEPTADAKPETAPLPAATDTDTATTQRVRKETGPHPASVVSLPKAGRESKGDLLAGWGWGTDKHDAIAPAGYTPDDDDYQAPDSKKTLTYVIGGGLAVVLLIVVIVFAFGGSSKKSKPSAKEIAAAEQAKRQAAAAVAPTEPPPAAVDEPAAGSAEAAGSAAVDEPARAAAEKAAAEQAAADKIVAEKAAAAQAEAAKRALMDDADRKKAEAAQARLDADAAKKAEADRKKAEAAQAKLDADAAKKIEADNKAAARAEARRVAQEEAARKKTEADAARAARAAEAAKNPPPAKTTTTAKTTRPEKTTTTTKTVATVDPKPKGDVNPETAYRQGLQAFARGDTAAALASLRSSLAANPNYAPTWRGLGLVFEKMGEKDQAKAAYRRYLQLVPNAGDAEIIRGRLERLGS